MNLRTAWRLFWRIAWESLTSPRTTSVISVDEDGAFTVERHAR